MDFAFKKLFGSEENTDILKGLINAILPDDEQMQEIILKNPYNSKSRKKDKLSILDIKAIDEKGIHYNIEMQITDQLSYDKRTLYYWSKLYADQMKEGDQFKDLKKTIGIHILNFNILDEADFHNTYKILNTKSKKQYSEMLELHTIELEKFDELKEKFKTPINRWINFLKKAERYEKKEIPAELMKDPLIKKAFKALEQINFDDDEVEVYQARLKWMRDEYAHIEAVAYKAELRGELRGQAKGKIEGEQIGLQKGEQIGIQKGKEKRDQEIIKSMQQNGFNLAQIAKVIGWAEAEIKKALL